MSTSSSVNSPLNWAITLLGILFVYLKLTKQIDWSWWWVTLPFWGGFVGIIIVLGLVAFIVAAGAVITKK